MKKLGNELARYVVYCCEGEKYVELTDNFRLATTRLALIEAIHALRYFGETLVNQSKQVIQLTPRDITQLCQFIQTAEISEVKQLHQTTITAIFTLELEKIKQTQQVIEELLVDLD